MRKTLLELQQAGSQEEGAYILMQRIFPSVSASILMRNGCCHKDRVISELGVFGTYLRYITWPHVCHLSEFKFVTLEYEIAGIRTELS